jgi:hypothetical protein
VRQCMVRPSAGPATGVWRRGLTRHIVLNLAMIRIRPLLRDAQFWIPVVVLVAGVLVLEWVR